MSALGTAAFLFVGTRTMGNKDDVILTNVLDRTAYEKGRRGRLSVIHLQAAQKRWMRRQASSSSVSDVA